LKIKKLLKLSLNKSGIEIKQRKNEAQQTCLLNNVRSIQWRVKHITNYGYD